MTSTTTKSPSDLEVAQHALAAAEPFIKDSSASLTEAYRAIEAQDDSAAQAHALVAIAEGVQAFVAAGRALLTDLVAKLEAETSE